VKIDAEHACRWIVDPAFRGARNRHRRSCRRMCYC